MFNSVVARPKFKSKFGDFLPLKKHHFNYNVWYAMI
jgi:hypothetical protein